MTLNATSSAAPTVAPSGTSTPLVDVRNLDISFPTEDGYLQVVHQVSFTLGREKLAIVGESGSGKSTVGRALLRLHPPSTRISAERCHLGDMNLLTATEAEMQAVRGQSLSMILQDPKFSLNPVMRVGEQITETYLTHHRVSRQEARERALHMLERVQIRDPQRVYQSYPHEVSGGMGQRIMIAMMLITRPQVIIADEPTSALDVSVRQQVLAILDELVETEGMGLVFISHDLNLVQGFCDRVAVMYAGRLVETLDARDLANAQHPYTQGLLAALPRMEQPLRRLPVLQRDPAWLNPAAGATGSGVTASGMTAAGATA